MKYISDRQYKIKVFDEWIDATAKSDPSVKEVFFVDKQGNYYLDSEVEKAILL